ncbi:HEL154Cp [Eremothecium sinecaudum]|uniref:HEL154Cp n=1 Tax=Eremothecium sinecaudum TaxID=45286 RepID=A0A0X8HTB2_9SACH|nr:HEL154Cp [Eremothecium sinecaudum]AMD21127.1 HEL154Cp [Eremothecium sinecaudum]
MSQENNKRSVDDTSNSATKKPKTTDNTGISEADVGISHYITAELPGFRGQIKQRYSDFMVNEVKKDGETVYLTDKGFKMPKREKPSAEELKERQEAEAAKRKDFKVDEEIRAQLVEILGEEDMCKIEDVYFNGAKMETSKSFDDKSNRTKIHQLLRQAFDNKLESVTSETNTFRVAMSNKGTRVNKQELLEKTKDANGVVNWGYGPSKPYLHFTMYKENKDTMDAVNTIAKYLRIPTKLVRFAGTKDRRAVTCQRLSVSTIGVDRLNSLNQCLKGIALGGFKFENESLSLGDLDGNEFVIVIREVSTSPESTMGLETILKEGCSSLENKGFINYYGMQRFGTFSISTHEIGKYLLNEQWKTAADLILSEQVNVLPKSVEARKIWAETKDPKLALAKMPRQCLAETAILYELARHTVDEHGDFPVTAYYTAIMKIPRNLRTMYVHAYQSYVWNMVASKRIELHGLNVVAGDLVLDQSGEEKDLLALDPTDSEPAFAEDLRETQFARAKPLSQADVESGKWSIQDVLLPTPGFDILYPENEELKNLYVEIMAKDNLDPFTMKKKVRDFSLAGSYRNIIQTAKNIEYHIVKYDNSTQQLINTDLEIMNNKKAKENGRSYMKDKLERIIPEKDGNMTAIILKFKLDISAYATMALRELMKLETSRRGDMCDVRT